MYVKKAQERRKVFVMSRQRIKWLSLYEGRRRMRLIFLRVRLCMLYLRFQPNFRDTQSTWLSVVLVDVLQSYVDVMCAVDCDVVRGIFVKRTRCRSLWFVFQQRKEFGRKAKKRFGYFEDGSVCGRKWI